MRFCLALFLACFGWTVQAADVGEKLAPRTLLDQFEAEASLDGETRLLLVASSREAAGLVDEALKGKPDGYLAARNALYVADVSQMPSMVTNWVLIPSMRSADYRILLDRDSLVAPEHLGAGDEVLWLELDDLKVLERQTFDSSEALREALERQAQ